MNHLQLISAFSVLALGAIASAQETEVIDNGTNPAVLSPFVSLSYEYLDLRRDFRNETLWFKYATPIDAAARTNVRVKVPFVSTDVLGRSGYGIGDVGVRVNHVYRITEHNGIIFNGELFLNTGDRVERGSGKNVLEVGGTYAFFRPDGSIFAPSILHAVSLWGESGRADVNRTTLDFYYVPKLADPKVYVTVDPSAVFDWESEDTFFGVAVTAGRTVGKLWGGNASVFLKPSVFLGGERPANWGIELGFKVVGF